MFWLLSTAFADDAISISIQKHGQVKTQQPALIVHVHQPLENLSLQLRCGSFSKSLDQPAGRGDVRIAIDVKEGNVQCSGQLGIELDDGSTGEMPLNFSVQMHPPLKMTIPEEKVNIDEETLFVKLDRPAEKFSIELLDSDNLNIGQGQTEIDPVNNLSLNPVQWESISDDVAVIRVVGKDIYGFTTQTELFPWHYDIPHEDVIFDSGQSNIPNTESYKLTAVQSEITSVVKKYSKFAVVNLYVAGYTDTVGDAASNLRLSTSRAKSIAVWFQAQGFDGHIYYQGFGEKVLAVPTADNVDEAQNRRSLYVVAATPPVSASFPGAQWTKLQ